MFAIASHRSEQRAIAGWAQADKNAKRADRKADEADRDAKRADENAAEAQRKAKEAAEEKRRAIREKERTLTLARLCLKDFVASQLVRILTDNEGDNKVVASVLWSPLDQYLTTAERHQTTAQWILGGDPLAGFSISIAALEAKEALREALHNLVAVEAETSKPGPPTPLPKTWDELLSKASVAEAIAAVRAYGEQLTEGQIEKTAMRKHLVNLCETGLLIVQASRARQLRMDVANDAIQEATAATKQAVKLAETQINSGNEFVTVGDLHRIRAVALLTRSKIERMRAGSPRQTGHAQNGIVDPASGSLQAAIKESTAAIRAYNKQYAENATLKNAMRTHLTNLSEMGLLMVQALEGGDLGASAVNDAIREATPATKEAVKRAEILLSLHDPDRNLSIADIHRHVLCVFCSN